MIALCARCAMRPARLPLVSSRGEPHTAGYWPCEICSMPWPVDPHGSLFDQFVAWLRQQPKDGEPC